MKCKLMSLLMVLGLIGCKADTGTVMYVVSAPLPDDQCVYPELATEQRVGGTFDPTVGSSMPTMFSVHNSLNAKNTDQRVDDNGVNIRPDANHIQLDEARVCYYRTSDLDSIEAHECSADTPVCAPTPDDGSVVSIEPCMQTQSVFAVVLAEESSTPDQGKNVLVDMMDLDVMRHLFGSSFNPAGIQLALEHNFSNCQAVGVSLESPVGDAACLGATASDLNAIGAGGEYGGKIVRIYRPNRALSGTATGLFPDGENFFSTGTGFGAERVVAKVQFSGQTVSGTDVTSSPFIFPIDVIPGAATLRAGACVQERVICSEQQPNCEYQGANGVRKVGSCVSTIGSEETYQNGCLLGGGAEFEAGDVERVGCRFGVIGGAPEIATCEPWALGGVAEDYSCSAEDSCEQVSELTVALGCGDGIVGTSEVCDDGFTDACGSCNADCSAINDSALVVGDGICCSENEDATNSADCS